MKYLAFLLCLLMATPAYGNGKFTKVEKGAEVPFEAWCYDHEANARLVLSKRETEEQCELKLSQQQVRLKRFYEYKLDGLTIELDVAEKAFEKRLKIKEEQIEKLEIKALGNNCYTEWWTAGGFVAGILTSVAIFWVANK